MVRIVQSWLGLFCIGLCLSSPSASAGRIDNRALADEFDGSNWPAYSRSFSENRFSPLTQVNAKTVKRLKLAWSLDLPDINNVSSQPLAVDGVIYFSVGQAIVHAVDAKTGKLLWRHDPEVAKHARHKMRSTWGSRGLAFWNGKVYVGTLDGRLIALDAATGKEVWSVMTVDPEDDRYISGAPRVFNGKVIIGNGGGDVGHTRGYVTTYDAETGRQLWRFYTVPGNPADGFENKAMAMAAKTWSGEWWKNGGGAAAWGAMTYDPEYNRVYIGTGNALPWNPNLRSPQGGDCLFVASIVALDADTGDYVWHYQTTPGDVWDFDADTDMVLATVAIEGTPRKVLMQAPKNGFFYVIDRDTGKLVSAEKLGKVTWAERIDLATGRPVEAPNARYQSGETLVWPGPAGLHSGAPMSYSPQTGLVYVPTTELPGYYNNKGIDPATWKSRPHFPGIGLNFSTGDAPPDAGSSALVAWNPLLQKAAWKAATPGVHNGGTIATAGNLVFQGQIDGKFKAYAADSGQPLWSFDARNGIVAAPITYRAGGKQYVAVLAGLGGAPAGLGSLSAQFGWQARIHPRRLLAFALDGKAVLPPTPPPARVTPIDDPAFVVDKAKAERGGVKYILCLVCHGPGVVSGGQAPDLRASPIALNAATFEQVVRQGTVEPRGMPRFQELSDEDLDNLMHFVRSRARETLAGKPVK